MSSTYEQAVEVLNAAKLAADGQQRVSVLMGRPRARPHATLLKAWIRSVFCGQQAQVCPFQVLP